MFGYVYLVGIFGFLFGAGIGSFAGAVIWRIKHGKSIAKGRSQCTRCKHRLCWYELVPIFSYYLLGAKCKKCKKPISTHYFLSEFIHAVVYAFVFCAIFLFFARLQTIPFVSVFDIILYALFIISVLSLLSLFIITGIYDLLYYEVPEKPLLAMYAFLAVLLVSETLLLSRGSYAPFLAVNNYAFSDLNISFSPLFIAGGKLITALMFFLLFFMLNRLTKQKGMGWGDVLFVPMVGVFLAFPANVIALLSSFIVGAIISVIWALAKHRKIKGVHIPYLPFLCASSVVVFMLQADIIKWLISYVYGI